MGILGKIKQSESWKSIENLFLKKGTNLVEVKECVAMIAID